MVRSSQQSLPPARTLQQCRLRMLSQERLLSNLRSQKLRSQKLRSQK